MLLKDLASVPEKLGFAPERLAFAPERRGIASERLGLAPEGLGFAPGRLGFARIRKPATLIFGFWQGEIGICAWEACGSYKTWGVVLRTRYPPTLRSGRACRRALYIANTSECNVAQASEATQQT